MKIARDNFANAFILISGFINPLLLFFEPGVLIPALIVQLLAIMLCCDTHTKRLLVPYLFACQYFGISMLGVKLYDLSLVFFIFSFILFSRDLTIENNPFAFPPVMFFLVFLFFMIPSLVGSYDLKHPLIEYSRYISCFITLLIFCSFRIQSAEFNRFVLPLIIANVVNGVMIYILNDRLGDHNITEGAFTVEYYNWPGEYRLTGFFSDPSKYCLYFLFFIFFIQLQAVFNKPVKNLILIYSIAGFGIVCSLARMGVMALGGFLFMRSLKRFIFMDNDKLFYQVILVTVLPIVIFYQQFFDLLDVVIREVTVLIGRESSLAVDSSVRSGSRASVWIDSFRLFLDRPFAGHGLSSWQKFFEYPTHNTFLLLLIDFGVIGLIFFVAIFFRFFKQVYREEYFFFFLLPCFVLDMESYRLHYVLLAILLTASVPKTKVLTNPVTE